MRRPLRIVLGLAATAGAIAAIWRGVDAHRRQRAERLGSALEAAAGPVVYHYRWRRPVIGGAPRNCNATDALDGAIGRLALHAHERVAVAARRIVLLDRPTTPEVARFVEEHKKALRALRDSVRCEWVGAANGPDRTWRADQAAALLLVASRYENPPHCLAIGLDVVRLLQDTGSRNGRAQPNHDAPLLRATRSRLLECAARADDPTDLQHAAADAAVLARTPPPVGEALGCAAVTSARIAIKATVRPDPASSVLWIQRGFLLDDAERLIPRITTLGAYDNAAFPALFARLERDLPQPAWMPLASHQAGDGGPPAGEIADFGGHLRDALRLSAVSDRGVRLLAVALAALRDRATTRRFPVAGPSERSMPALRDPLTGSPFAWSVRGSRATLAAPAARGAARDEIVLGQ